MNGKQYNNVINHTLQNDKNLKNQTSLEQARAIFKNLGVALPSGDVKTIFESLKTNSFMGWRSCTKNAAQEAANNGIAAMGINEETIVVLSADNEEEQVTETASVMTLSSTSSVNNASNLRYFSYGYAVTTE